MPFQPGDAVTCIQGSDPWLLRGQQYLIRESWPAYGLVAVGPRAGPREMLWWEGRFQQVVGDQQVDQERDTQAGERPGQDDLPDGQEAHRPA